MIRKEYNFKEVGWRLEIVDERAHLQLNNPQASEMSS